jgi:hypothetical protein
LVGSVEITPYLDEYNAVTLPQLDSLCLMNRQDNKFVYSVNKLPDVLKEASKYYKILEINNHRSFYYVSKYLDTPELRFYHDHHNGRANRYKIRLRTYEINQLSFLEIKHKTNKGNTEKSRIKVQSADFIDNTGKAFISKHIKLPVDTLDFVSVNCFERITLASFETRERITIDFNLSFTQNKKSLNFPKLCITEIKRERSSARSPINDIMKKIKGVNTSMSKYCIGTAFLNNKVKQNSFKPKKILINNIENGTYIH